MTSRARSARRIGRNHEEIARKRAWGGWKSAAIHVLRLLPPPPPPPTLSRLLFCGFHADQQPSRILKTLKKANVSSVYLSFIPIASRTISFLLCRNPCGFAVLPYYPLVKLLPYSCYDFRVLDLNICKYG